MVILGIQFLQDFLKIGLMGLVYMLEILNRIQIVFILI